MTIIEDLYELLSKEFSVLQNSLYPKHKIDGYEDALWDFKIIAKDHFSIELPIVQKGSVKNECMLCICGHEHREHLATTSINYTAGRCTKCTCKNFLLKQL